MPGRIALAAVAGLLACGCAGAFAGLDASSNVDGFYTAPRWHEERLPPMPASSPWDWNEVPRTPAPDYGTVSDAGPSERAFFDPGPTLREIDAAVERIAPVRVHRASARRVVDEPLPPLSDDAPAATVDDLPKSDAFVPEGTEERPIDQPA